MFLALNCCVCMLLALTLTSLCWFSIYRCRCADSVLRLSPQLAILSKMIMMNSDQGKYHVLMLVRVLRSTCSGFKALSAVITLQVNVRVVMRTLVFGAFG
jgi:hypothetical protein